MSLEMLNNISKQYHISDILEEFMQTEKTKGVSGQPSKPSNKLAGQIVTALLQQNQGSNSLQKLFMQLRDKKSLVAEKFSKYICNSLTKLDPEPSVSVECLAQASTVMQETKSLPSQCKALAAGFITFWESCQQKEKKVETHFQLSQTIKRYICVFHVEMCESVLNYLVRALDTLPSQIKQKHCNRFAEELQNCVRQSTMTESSARRCCLIIHHLNLQEKMKIEDLIAIVSSGLLPQCYKIFMHYPMLTVNRELVEMFIDRKLNSSMPQIKRLINYLKLNPYDYPQLIKLLIKKALYHFLHEEPLEMLDLKMQGRPDVVECLIEILLSQGKHKQATHFINKYYMKQFYHLRGAVTSYNKNILLVKDYFGPTEPIMSKSPTAPYLTMQSMGYAEQSVLFVDQANINSQLLDDVMASAYLGIDCQGAPIYHTYEPKSTTLLQIALPDKVYIFDIVTLKNNDLFREWYKRLVEGYPHTIFGHTLKNDLTDIINELGLRNTQVKAESVDVSNLFRKKNPKETKSSLEYICSVLFERKLSKFEQCSGWHARPLRRAQLHYAALDAVLPIRIFDALAN